MKKTFFVSYFVGMLRNLMRLENPCDTTVRRCRTTHSPQVARVLLYAILNPLFSLALNILFELLFTLKILSIGVLGCAKACHWSKCVVERFFEIRLYR